MFFFLTTNNKITLGIMLFMQQAKKEIKVLEVFGFGVLYTLQSVELYWVRLGCDKLGLARLGSNHFC